MIRISCCKCNRVYSFYDLNYKNDVVNCECGHPLVFNSKQPNVSKEVKEKKLRKIHDIYFFKTKKKNISEYKRNLDKMNKDHVQQYWRKYYLIPKNRFKHNASSKKYRQKPWYNDYYRAYRKQYMSIPKNRQRENERVRNWRKAHPGYKQTL